MGANALSCCAYRPRGLAVGCSFVSSALRCPAATPFSPIDSLRHALDAAPADTTRVLLLSQLAAELTHIDPLATIAYCRQALQLAQKSVFAGVRRWT